jgi:hypothetical protein
MYLATQCSSASCLFGSGRTSLHLIRFLDAHNEHKVQKKTERLPHWRRGARAQQQHRHARQSHQGAGVHAQQRPLLAQHAMT